MPPVIRETDDDGQLVREMDLEEVLDPFRELATCRPDALMLMREMALKQITKGHDYSGTEDSYSNLRECEKIGVPAWKGVLVRMGDKWSRLHNFSRQGVLKVKDESIGDTLLDLAVYCLIFISMWREAKSAERAQAKDEIAKG